jgi:hypothetical protein
MVAMAISLPVFFVFSGQRLRGLLALIPIATALLVSFSDLNGVYLTLLNEGDPGAALDRAVPTVWLTSGAAAVYGLLWALIDRWWKPPPGVVRIVGAAVLIAFVAVFAVGMGTLVESEGSPITWTGQKWEAFKANDTTGKEQSRYLSASGSGRYALWQVAWKDFTSHPVLGVGTHNYEATYYQLREQDVGYARQPHALPLEVLGERGIVGGALFFGFLTVCLVGGLRRRFAYLDAEGKAAVGAVIAAITYWFVHCCADWFWQLPAVTLTAVVYLAVLIAPWRRVEREPQGWFRRTSIAAAAVLTIVLITPLYISDRYLTESYVTENPWVALEAIERAQRFNPLDPQLPQREAELAMQIGNWPRVKVAYGEAIKLNPEHYAPYALLAQFHEDRGEPEEALALYREALALNPLDRELDRSITRLTS